MFTENFLGTMCSMKDSSEIFPYGSNYEMSPSLDNQ